MAQTQRKFDSRKKNEQSGRHAEKGADDQMRVRLKSNGNYWQAFCKGHGARSLGSKTNISQRKAEALCREWEFDLRLARMSQQPKSNRAESTAGNATPSAPAGLPSPRLSEWLKAYPSHRPHLSHGTKQVIRFTSEYLKRHFSEDPPIEQITREQASRWRAALAAGTLSAANEFRTDAPSETTVCKHVRSARSIFKEATRQELISINPFDRLHSTAPEVVRDWVYVDASGMHRLMAASPNDAWRALWGLMRYAGLRLSEALMLRWIDVDFARNRIEVSAAGVITKRTNKARSRTCPIEAAKVPTGLAKILHNALLHAPEGAMRVCQGVPKNNRDRKSGKILKAAGLTRWSKLDHTLRKNAEMDWAAKYPQHVVCDWIGHDMAVSQKHYLRVPEELYAPPQVAQPQMPNP